VTSSIFGQLTLHTPRVACLFIFKTFKVFQNKLNFFPKFLKFALSFFKEMVRKKIDNRLRVMIENGVALGHRTMFVVVGDKGRDQVKQTKNKLK
jgi:hypothetical protein